MVKVVHHYEIYKDFEDYITGLKKIVLEKEYPSNKSITRYANIITQVQYLQILAYNSNKELS